MSLVSSSSTSLTKDIPSVCVCVCVCVCSERDREINTKDKKRDSTTTMLAFPLILVREYEVRVINKEAVPCLKILT